MTKSMKNAIEETNRRRKIQSEYNEKHGIIPKTITKNSIILNAEKIENKEKVEERTTNQ